MLSVPFVYSMSRFQGPAFLCDKIVVLVTLPVAIEGIPEKDYQSEPFIENQSEHISKLSLDQSLVKRKFIHCDF